MKFSNIILAGTMSLFSSTAFAVSNNAVKAPIVRDILPNPGLNAQINILPVKTYKKEISYEVLVLPENARLYYHGALIEKSGLLITDPNHVMIDPDDGDVTVFFSYKSIHSDGSVSEPRSVIIRFEDLEVSGTVYHDSDGNGKVDGGAMNNIDGKPLYVMLVNKESEVLASKLLSRKATFSFKSSDGIQPNNNYALIVSTQKASLTSILPEGWASSGENINSLSKGKDRHKDGVMIVNMKTQNIDDVAFGLDIRPLAVSKKGVTQLNPGSNSQVTVPKLEGSDKENGKSVRYYITSLPENATVYENGKKILKPGKEIKQTDKLTLDPENGDQKVRFNYLTADHAGVTSHAATIDMSFVGLSISGKVFNDGDNKEIVSGKRISQIEGEALYVTLLNEKNVVLASKAVDEKGRFSFDGLDGIMPESKYTIVLSTKKGVETSTLPKNWNNSDEGIMESDESADGLYDGKIHVRLHIKDMSNVNFGVNKKPEAEAITLSSQLNPGGSDRVSVPALIGKDNENSNTLVYSISTLPKNADLYDGNIKITKPGFVLSDPTKLTLDPRDGKHKVEFSYKVTDDDAVSSDPADVKLSFSELQLSGHLFNDGTADNNVSGKPLQSIDGKPLYLLLLNENKKLLSTKKLNKDGSYSFDGNDGVKPESQFVIALAMRPDVRAFGLPKGWNHTAEKINSLSGETDTQNDGVLVVRVERSNVSDIDFGINQKPTADHKKAKDQLNPGRDTAVPVPVFTGNDRESGNNLVYTIASLPTMGRLYYDGVKIEDIGFVIEESEKLALDPDNADLQVLFTYTVTDEAGIISDPTRVEMAFKDLTVSGHVVNNGKGDTNIKGKAIRIPKSMKPYATLLDENNTILSTKPLLRDASFSFSGKDGVYPNAIFSVVVSLEANATSAVLPVGWNDSRKEKSQDSNSTENENPAGKITIQILEKNIDHVEFGINQEPSADNKTVKSQVNPGGEARVAVPALSGNDREDGTHLNYMITKLAKNATLYDKNTVVKENTFVDPASLTLNPKDGKQEVTFAYVTVDSAKVLSAPASVSMTFTGLSISGTIFEDFMMDGFVDSVQTVGDDQVNVFMTLLDDQGEILASVPVQKDGTYVFDQTTGVNANTAYTVVLSKDANSSTSILPGGYNYADGENVNSLGQGNDGKADGKINIFVKNENLEKVDFSVNYLLQ